MMSDQQDDILVPAASLSFPTAPVETSVVDEIKPSAVKKSKLAEFGEGFFGGHLINYIPFKLNSLTTHGAHTGRLISILIILLQIWYITHLFRSGRRYIAIGFLVPLVMIILVIFWTET